MDLSAFSSTNNSHFQGQLQAGDQQVNWNGQLGHSGNHSNTVGALHSGTLPSQPHQRQQLEAMIEQRIHLASASELVLHRNTAYMHLLNTTTYEKIQSEARLEISKNQIDDLRSELKEARSTIQALKETTNSQSRSSHSSETHSAPNMSNAHVFVMPPAPTIYLKDEFSDKELFWDRTSWTKYYDQRKTVGKPVGPNGYLIHEDGTPLNAEELSAVSKTNNVALNTLYHFRLDPVSWAHKNDMARRFYTNYMCQHHPAFGLCDRNWKIEEYGKVHFPDWHRMRVKAPHKLSRAQPSIQRTSNTHPLPPPILKPKPVIPTLKPPKSEGTATAAVAPLSKRPADDTGVDVLVDGGKKKKKARLDGVLDGTAAKPDGNPNAFNQPKDSMTTEPPTQSSGLEAAKNKESTAVDPVISVDTLASTSTSTSTIPPPDFPDDAKNPSTRSSRTRTRRDILKDTVIPPSTAMPSVSAARKRAPKGKGKLVTSGDGLGTIDAVQMPSKELMKDPENDPENNSGVIAGRAPAENNSLHPLEPTAVTPEPTSALPGPFAPLAKSAAKSQAAAKFIEPKEGSFTARNIYLALVMHTGTYP